MRRIANDELNTGIALADSKRDFMSNTQARKNSDFVNKDKPPYGVLSGLAVVSGVGGIVTSGFIYDDKKEWTQLSKTCFGCGLAVLAVGVGLGIYYCINEAQDNEIKRAISATTASSLNAQSENDISVSDAYTAALMVNAEDQISNFSDLGVASSKIDLNNKISRSAMNTGAVAKTFSDDDFTTGINNLNTLNSNNISLVNGYVK